MHGRMTYPTKDVAVICEVPYPICNETYCHRLAWRDVCLDAEFIDGKTVSAIEGPQLYDCPLPSMNSNYRIRINPAELKVLDIRDIESPVKSRHDHPYRFFLRRWFFVYSEVN